MSREVTRAEGGMSRPSPPRGARLMGAVRSPWLFRAAVAVGGVVAVLSRLRGFDAVFWRDEVYTRWVCRHAFTDVPGVLMWHDVSPPFFYLLLNAWMSLFGDGDAALRASSLITGLAVVALGSLIALRWWGKTACLVMLALCATAPGMAYLSLEVRNQVIVSLLLLLAVWGLWAWWHTGRARWLACYALVSAAALYSHYLAWPALLVLALGFLVFVGKRRAVASRTWWAAHAVILLLLVPWMGGMERQLDGEARISAHRRGGSIVAAAGSTTVFLAGVDPLRAARVALRTRLSSSAADAAAVGLLALVVVALVYARQAPFAPWASAAVFAVIGVTVIMGALHGLHGMLSHSRYFPMFSPLLLLAATLGISRAPRAWGLCMVAGLVALQVMVGMHTVRRAPVPWPEVAAFLEADSPHAHAPVLSVYWLGAEALRQYGYRGEAVDLPFDLPGLEPERSRRVSALPLITADWPRMDRVIADAEEFWLITSTVDYDTAYEDDITLRDYLRTRNWQQRMLRSFGAAELRLFVRAGKAGQASQRTGTQAGRALP